MIQTETLSVLISRLNLAYAIGPVRPKLRVSEAHVADDVSVTNDKVIARTGLEKLLLGWQPSGFADPELDFRNLRAHILVAKSWFECLNLEFARCNFTN